VGQLRLFSEFVSVTADGQKLWAETVLALILGRDKGAVWWSYGVRKGGVDFFEISHAN
jgi:hypothetical protein